MLKILFSMSFFIFERYVSVMQELLALLVFKATPSGFSGKLLWLVYIYSIYILFN
jgi:hypothetical protein